MTDQQPTLSTKEKRRRDMALLFAAPSATAMMFRRQQWNEAAMTQEMFEEGVRRFREMERVNEQTMAALARKDGNHA